LRFGDEVEVELNTPESETFSPEEIPIDIIYEDDELVVVNKRAGLVVHPAAGIRSGTLANALAFHFQHLPGGSGTIRPGIVHRLDRDTSGLVARPQSRWNTCPIPRSNSLQVICCAGSWSRRQRGGRIDQPLGVIQVTEHEWLWYEAVECLVAVSVRRRYQRFTLP
jgi:23S rRNA pseudouridine1911/1915/1917 synthase